MLRYFSIFYFSVFYTAVFSLLISAQETTPAPFLGNPMEKIFNSGTIRESDGQTADVSRRAPLPSTPPSSADNTVKDNGSKTFTGWDIGPPPVAPSNGTQNPSAFNSSNQGSSIFDYNTYNTYLATPSQNFGGLLQNGETTPAIGNDYTLNNNYTAYQMQLQMQAAQLTQQQALQQQAIMQYAPYQMPYQNMYGGINPAAVNTQQIPKGDLFSNMMVSGAFEQNPMLYQAMLQQEELRHHQSLEDEEKKERKLEEKEKAENWTPSNYLPPAAGMLFSCLKTISPFNTPTGPDRGVGMPLLNRSWLDRPMYAGGFVGKMSGDELVSNMIDQKSGSNGGLIFGFNVNDYWGLDGRLHFSSLDIKETAAGEQVYQQWYAAQNSGQSGQSTGTLFVPPLTTRTNQMTIIDVSVHYYPLGNAKFRPFFKYGIGAVRETFKDTYGMKHHIDTMAMPVGVGLKYWWNERVAIQMDIIDNVIFSRDITKTQNNWAFSAGVTYSFGSSKKRKPVSYWPYTPSNGSRR